MKTFREFVQEMDTSRMPLSKNVVDRRGNETERQNIEKTDALTKLIKDVDATEKYYNQLNSPQGRINGGHDAFNKLSQKAGINDVP